MAQDGRGVPPHATRAGFHTQDRGISG